MRTAFIETLCELAETDEHIWLLTGDLGYSVLERFATRFPQRYLNVGVAEQNMIGLAAGLALCGKTPFVYSIANFPVMRCLEQIRDDVCYHQLNVKIVAVGGGLAYGAAGYTHHGIEDLAVMQALPNMTVVAPGDPIEARAATQAIVNQSGPCYLRLGKGGEAIVHQAPIKFEVGQAIVVRPGETVTLMSIGSILETVIRAAQVLSDSGCSARVLSMPTLQPLDRAAVLDAARTTAGILTIEEHGPGGLSAAVAEVLAEASVCTRFSSLRVKPSLIAQVGSQATLRQQHGLTVDNIVAAAIRLRDSSSNI
jgi:transketolase